MFLNRGSKSNNILAFTIILQFQPTKLIFKNVNLIDIFYLETNKLDRTKTVIFKC